MSQLTRPAASILALFLFTIFAIIVLVGVF